MRKIRVTAPAVATNIGPGVRTLGLALGMHVTATLSARSDSLLIVDSFGEDSEQLPADCYHPVMRAATRVFQALEDAPSGLNIEVHNSVPLDSGMGAEAAMVTAGLVGANELMGRVFKLEELVPLGWGLMGRCDGVAAALFGGLTVCAPARPDPLMHRYELPLMKVVLALPEYPDFGPVRLPARLATADALYDLGRHPLVVNALREGDYDLLSNALDDRLLRPRYAGMQGIEDVIMAARQAGGAAVSICGEGPALIVFAPFNYARVAEAVQEAFAAQGINARTWTVTVDRRGALVAQV